MKKFNLNNMIRGWFVGDFEPVAYKTDVCEVGVKSYKAGEIDPSHYHKVTTEITLIQSGKVQIQGVVYKEGDIVIVEPNQKTNLIAIENTVTVVVKIPSVPNDKYLVPRVSTKQY